jgi:hypothetical protein
MSGIESQQSRSAQGTPLPSAGCAWPHRPSLPSRSELTPYPDQIHVHLPSLAQLKGLASRFSHLGSTVLISANKVGLLVPDSRKHR